MKRLTAEFIDGVFTHLKPTGKRRRRWRVRVYAEGTEGGRAEDTLVCREPVRFQVLRDQLLPGTIDAVLSDLAPEPVRTYGFTVEH